MGIKNYRLLGVSQKLLVHIEISKVEWRNRMPKFPSKVKVIKIKNYYFMNLKGALFDLEGALSHSLPKSGGATAPLAPRFLRPCLQWLYFICRTVQNILHRAICFFTRCLTTKSLTALVLDFNGYVFLLNNTCLIILTYILLTKPALCLSRYTRMLCNVRNWCPNIIN